MSEVISPDLQAGKGRKALYKRKKFLIAGAMLFVAIGFAAYLLTQQVDSDYLTIDELMAKGDSVSGELVRVGGHIVDDSVNWDTEAVTLSFTLTDGEETLPVVYRGTVPDSFKAAREIVAEGELDKQGIFIAHSLKTKCPSKYEKLDSYISIGN